MGEELETQRVEVNCKCRSQSLSQACLSDSKTTDESDGDEIRTLFSPLCNSSPSLGPKYKVLHQIGPSWTMLPLWTGFYVDPSSRPAPCLLSH